MEQAAAAPAPDAAPAPIPITAAELTFAEQRRLTREGAETVPAKAAEPAAKAAGEPQGDQADADSTKPDSALSDAARTLRKNRADARKAQIKSEIDDLTAEKYRLRAELDAARRERAGLGAAASTEARPAAQPSDADPSDPEPTLDAIAAKYPNEADPYAKWQRELAKWDRRQDERQQFAQRQRATAQHAQGQALGSFHEQAEKFKAEHADYDAVFDGLVQAVAGNPRERAITEAITTLGPSFAYHLAKHQSDLNALLTAPHPRDLVEAIGVLKFKLAEAAKAPAPKPSAAPAPHQPTAASGTTVPPAKDDSDLSFGEFRRIREAERRAARA